MMCLTKSTSYPSSVYNVHQVRGFRPIVKLIPFFCFSIMSFIIYHQYLEVFGTYPNVILYFLLCGAVFAFAVARLITSHIAKMGFPFWTPGYLPFILLSLGVLIESLGDAISRTPRSATWILSVSLAFTVVAYVRLVRATICQICQFLNINCLRIKHPRHE